MTDYEKNFIKVQKLKKAKFLLIQKYMILTLDIEEIIEIGFDFVIKTTNGDIKNFKYDTWIKRDGSHFPSLEALIPYKTRFAIYFSNRIIGYIVKD